MSGIRNIQTRLGTKAINMVDWNAREIPETVYKYRDWTNDYHKRILLNREIFFASPISLNDPYDCRIHVDHSVLKTDEELRLRYFNDLVERHKPELMGDEKMDEITRLIAEGRFNDDSYIEKCDVDSITKLHSILGVFSVTAVRDNTVMWAHYANNHQGFCIGFNSFNLFNEIGQDGLAEGGPINYSVDYPQVLPTSEFEEQWRQQIYTKADFWDYEIEYRLARGEANRAFVIPEEFIAEVIFGNKMINEHRIEISQYLQENLPHVRVFEMKPRHRGFDIDIIEIE